VKNSPSISFQDIRRAIRAVISETALPTDLQQKFDADEAHRTFSPVRVFCVFALMGLAALAVYALFQN
jgi:hypothetical protein